MQRALTGLYKNLFPRFVNVVRSAVPMALKSALWLIKVIIPVSLAVTLLSFFGIVDYIAEFLNPVFGILGLPGEASIVFITSIFLNVYSSIAAISQLGLSLREITILMVMGLIAHNLIVETMVQVKTGSKAWQIVLLRISAAIFSGLALNWLLPIGYGGEIQILSSVAATDFTTTLMSWAESSFFLCLRIVVIVVLLMILQQSLKEFGVVKILSTILSPFLKVLGLPKSTSFLWIIANTLGLTYGSAAMLQEVESGAVSKRDADLLNFHIAVSHSNLEDMLLLGAIGVSAAWVLIPRLVFAAIVVWGKRLFSTKSSVSSAF